MRASNSELTSSDWTELANGIWNIIQGPPELVTPLGVVKAAPRFDAIDALPLAQFPGSLTHIEVQHVSGKTVIRFPVGEKESIHGLGLQFFKVDHRGRTRYLRVNSDPRQDTGESHAPIPLIVSSAGYAILVNTARIVTVHCCSTIRREESQMNIDRASDPTWQPTPPSSYIEIVVPGESFELIAFAGNSTLEVVQRYNLYCGGGCLPPRWGLGFWHRVHYQANAAAVMDEALEFRKRDIPCDVIGLEPGWQTHSYPCSYEWEPSRFPNPPEFLSEMAANGFKVNLWEHGYISTLGSLFPKLESYSGSHTVWGGIVPDYTIPEAQNELKAQHLDQHVRHGVSGYKLDECDGSELTGSSWMFPAHATFPSGLDGEQMRQIFGLLLQKLTAEIFHEQNRRTYGLVRASGAGASALPYVLYSDLYDHREFVRALCNSGFSGLLWCPEIRSAQNAEEWVRRMQVVCFSPMAMLNAWADSTKPWSYPEVENIIRKCIQLRMRLMPYFYSAFARYHYEGIPPFRAMAMEVAANEEERSILSTIDDQYMAGDSLMVAPLFAGQKEREVYLPTGIWFDFETGERFEGGRSMKVSASIEKLPVFVRNGSIIPMMPPLAHAPRAGESVPIEALHFGNEPGIFRLYDDDGETFAYENGSYCWRELQMRFTPEGEWIGSISPSPDGWDSSYSEVFWRSIR